jgi:hypothetical protein
MMNVHFPIIPTLRRLAGGVVEVEFEAGAEVSATGVEVVAEVGTGVSGAGVEA